MSKTVYLIHFDTPHKHARHYLGYTSDLYQRMVDHSSGAGARLLAVLRELGIGWQVVRTWKGGRDLERKLKARKEAPRLCPICNPNGHCAESKHNR